MLKAEKRQKLISICNKLQLNIVDYLIRNFAIYLKYNIIVAVNKLEIADEREEAELKLIEYNIDADNEEEIDLYRQFDFLQIKMISLKWKISYLH